jgi:hypothetical protein
VANYRFVTECEITAPVRLVWPEVSQAENWMSWWPGLVAVTPLERGDDEGGDSLHELTFKSRLPYTLSLRARITRVEQRRRIDVEADGELQGVAVYELEDLGETTAMRLTWTVRTNKAWMNLLAPIARPLFSWNHDVLMKAGMRGLARKVGGDVARFETGHSSRRAKALLAACAGALWMGKRALSRR